MTSHLDRTVNCIICDAQFTRTDTQMRNNVPYCLPCRTAQSRDRRARLREQGLPVRTPKPEYHRAYDAEYHQRPEVRARRCEQSKRRHADPVEREKNKARWTTRRAIAVGKLVRQPCEVCGETRVDAHHDDYSKPFDVRWLCRLHHRQHHLQLTQAAKLGSRAP
jgi:hypothetical protein